MKLISIILITSFLIIGNVYAEDCPDNGGVQIASVKSLGETVSGQSFDPSSIAMRFVNVPFLGQLMEVKKIATVAVSGPAGIAQAYVIGPAEAKAMSEAMQAYPEFAELKGSFDQVKGNVDKGKMIMDDTSNILVGCNGNTKYKNVGLKAGEQTEINGLCNKQDKNCKVTASGAKVTTQSDGSTVLDVKDGSAVNLCSSPDGKSPQTCNNVGDVAGKVIIRKDKNGKQVIDSFTGEATKDTTLKLEDIGERVKVPKGRNLDYSRGQVLQISDFNAADPENADVFIESKLRQQMKLTAEVTGCSETECAIRIRGSEDGGNDIAANTPVTVATSTAPKTTVSPTNGNAAFNVGEDGVEVNQGEVETATVKTTVEKGAAPTVVSSKPPTADNTKNYIYTNPKGGGVIEGNEGTLNAQVSQVPTGIEELFEPLPVSAAGGASVSFSEQPDGSMRFKPECPDKIAAREAAKKAGNKVTGNAEAIDDLLAEPPCSCMAGQLAMQESGEGMEVSLAPQPDFKCIINSIPRPDIVTQSECEDQKARITKTLKEAANAKKAEADAIRYEEEKAAKAKQDYDVETKDSKGEVVCYVQTDGGGFTEITDGPCAKKIAKEKKLDTEEKIINPNEYTRKLEEFKTLKNKCQNVDAGNPCSDEEMKSLSSLEKTIDPYTKKMQKLAAIKAQVGILGTQAGSIQIAIDNNDLPMLGLTQEEAERRQFARIKAINALAKEGVNLEKEMGIELTPAQVKQDPVSRFAGGSTLFGQVGDIGGKLVAQGDLGDAFNPLSGIPAMIAKSRCSNAGLGVDDPTADHLSGNLNAKYLECMGSSSGLEGAKDIENLGESAQKVAKLVGKASKLAKGVPSSPVAIVSAAFSIESTFAPSDEAKIPKGYADNFKAEPIETGGIQIADFTDEEAAEPGIKIASKTEEPCTAC